MTEIPNFLEGIDPEMVRDLEQQLQAEWDANLELEAAVLESNRRGYMRVLSHKMAMIDRYFQKKHPGQMMEIAQADEMARTYFLYYLDKVFAGPETGNKQVQLAEALAMADITQESINQEQTGQPLARDVDEWQARVAEILLEDDEVKAKQDVIDVYDRDIREVILRFLHH